MASPGKKAFALRLDPALYTALERQGLDTRLPLQQQAEAAMASADFGRMAQNGFTP